MADNNYIDFKNVTTRIVQNWYLFVFSIILFIALAFVFNKFSKPYFTIRSLILIDEETNIAKKKVQNFLESFDMFSKNKNIHNEISILNSEPIIRKMITNLGLSVSYHYNDNIWITNEAYKNSPIVVIFDENSIQPVNMDFHINFIDDKSFQIKALEKNIEFYSYRRNEVVTNMATFDIDRVVAFGHPISGDNYSFTIILNPQSTYNDFLDKNFHFRFHNENKLVNYYKNQLIISPVKEMSSIISISLEDANIKKAEDIINGITSEYLIRNLNKKNFLAKNTIKYINEQINTIENELLSVEKNLQVFRSSHQVMNIQLQANRVYDKLQELEKEKEILGVKLKYYSYIQEYFNNNDTRKRELLVPSSMGIEDPLLNDLIYQLATFYGERSSLIQNSQDKSPYLRTLNQKIGNLTLTINENINYSINATISTVENIDVRLKQLKEQIEQLPKTEQKLVGIERKFKLNDGMYTFLLQKSAEAEIAKASNLPDSDIIERARMLNKSFPNPPISFTIAFFLGLVLPGAFVFIKDYYNDELREPEEAEKLSPFPVLGKILHNNTKTINVFNEIPTSPISESFRAIRTNLQFFSQGKNHQIIMLSSSFSGEGKSFNCINIAASFASFGKKTIIIDYDLRKPGLLNNFHIKNKNIGVASYLIDKSKITDIIIKSEMENLDIIPAGPVPPNPVELIASERTEKLLERLKQEYEFIIIDTPPLGLVTDAFLLMKYSDINIVLARLGITPKKIFQSNIKEIKNKGIENVSILLNDYKLNSSSYGYGEYFKKRKRITKRNKKLKKTEIPNAG